MRDLKKIQGFAIDSEYSNVGGNTLEQLIGHLKMEAPYSLIKDCDFVVYLADEDGNNQVKRKMGFKVSELIKEY